MLSGLESRGQRLLPDLDDDVATGQTAQPAQPAQTAQPAKPPNQPLQVPVEELDDGLLHGHPGGWLVVDFVAHTGVDDGAHVAAAVLP